MRRARAVSRVLAGLFFASNLLAGEIFVSPNGDNSNSGRSRSQPLRTIAAAAQRAVAGDVIRLLPGVFRGTTSLVKINGLPEMPITIMSDSPDPAAFAIIDGGVELVDGVAPGGQIANDLPNYGFSLERCSWLEITQLKFRNCWAHVIVIRNSSYISVKGCDIRSGKRSIYPRDGSHHVLVENNHWQLDDRVWHTWDWASMHHGVGGSPAGVLEMEHFNGALLHPKESGGSHVMRGNVLKNIFNGYRTKTARLSQDSNTEVYDNAFINVRDNAFEPESFAWNVHFYHNRIFNCHKSFSIDDVAGGFIYIYGNMQSQEREPGMGPHVAGGGPDGVTGIWKFKGPPVLSQPCYAFNNSFYTHAIAFRNGEASNQQMKHFNNVYEFFTSASGAGGMGLFQWHDSFEFDHDAVNRSWPANITSGGQEVHGVITSTLFENGLGNPDASGQNFRLQAGSAAIDAGKVMALPEFEWLQSFNGQAPDMGAFEDDQLVSGPPFRFREPPGGVNYREKPRIVRHRIAGNRLWLYFSTAIDPATVAAAAIHLFENGTSIPVLDASFPRNTYELQIDAGQPVNAHSLSIYLSPLPRGQNGEPATHWASTLAVADRTLVTSVASTNQDSIRPVKSNKVSLRIYPNPIHAGGKAMLHLPQILAKPAAGASNVRAMTLDIYDIRGRLVRKFHPIANGEYTEQRLSASAWPNGVYFAVYRAGPNTAVTKFTVLK